MLGKLIKFDFKATAKQQIPLLIFLAASTVVLTFLILLTSFTAQMGSRATSIVEIISGSLFVIIAVTMVAYPFITIFLILQRYYKSMFTDEGYLTFTLPTSTDKILLAKITNGIIWSVISIVSLAISIGIIGFTAFNLSSGFESLLNFVLDFFQETFYLRSLFPVVKFLFFSFIGLASNLVIYFTAITIGAVLSKKHKILTAIGIYYLINISMSILGSIVALPAIFMSRAPNLIATQGFLIEFLIDIIFIIAGYYACRYTINNKLNLE